MYKVGRSRTPQGVRGLKLSYVVDDNMQERSHSARSAWIETARYAEKVYYGKVALRKECVD